MYKQFEAKKIEEAGRRETNAEPAAIKAIIDNFAANTNATGLQFSGGEPTLREDLPELISYARKKFDHVEVDTNGLKMAESEEYCKEIESAGTSVVYLQFDAVTEEPYEKLRGQKLLAVKKKAIENHRKAGLKKIPVFTALQSIRPGFLKRLFIGFIKSHNYWDLCDLLFNLLFIGSMHFMDPYNFDLARVRKCVIHYS